LGEGAGAGVSGTYVAFLWLTARGL
jgi:hypothetical protein